MDFRKLSFFMFCLQVICTQISGQLQNPDFDAELAKKMGADEYGMKSYMFVILKTGEATIENGPRRDSIFSGHLKNIQRLEEAGTLIVAGPLGSNDKTYRGIFIFNVTSKEELENLLKTDPAINSKIFATEIFDWYGSAALGEYLKVHKKIAKELF